MALLILVALSVACGSGPAHSSPRRLWRSSALHLAGDSDGQACCTAQPDAGRPRHRAGPHAGAPALRCRWIWLAADVQRARPFQHDACLAPAGRQRAAAAVNEAALAGWRSGASVVVENLQDGRYAATNESQTWYAASTFKAAILLTAYQQRDAGLLDFEKVVTLEDKYTQYDLGTLDGLGLRTNDQVTIRDAIKGMIVVSDTSLAALMQDQVGGNNVDATLRDIGATVMTVNSHDLPTTALDLARLMIAITAGQGVSPESRDEMLSLLAQEWYTQGIVAGLPSGTQYAHKSGSLGAAVHDAGIVWGPAGPYVIVVMTDGSAGWTPIADVSSAVYNCFASAGQLPDDTTAPTDTP